MRPLAHPGQVDHPGQRVLLVPLALPDQRDRPVLRGRPELTAQPGRQALLVQAVLVGPLGRTGRLDHRGRADQRDRLVLAVHPVLHRFAWNF